MQDEDDLFVYQSDPEIVRYIPWPVRTRQQVRDALVRALTYTRFEDEGDGLVLAIEHREERRVIGQCNISYESRENAHGEFGYVVARSHARRGYATEASRAILRFGFETANLRRITARIDTRNLVSAAVCEKLGMRREAEFIEDDRFKGEWSSTWIYALLRREWDLAGR